MKKLMMLLMLKIQIKTKQTKLLKTTSNKREEEEVGNAFDVEENSEEEVKPELTNILKNTVNSLLPTKREEEADDAFGTEEKA